MKARKLIAALSCTALMVTMAACDNNGNADTSQANNGSSQSESSDKPVQQERTYTQADLDSASSECESQSVPGDDILNTITNGGDVILVTIAGTGITSSVYQCVINKLELPSNVVDGISENTYGFDATGTYSNLHLLWSTDGATVEKLYISLDDFE